MKIDLPAGRSNGGSSEVDIRSFETRRGVTLPEDFRQFLVEHDGAAFGDNTLDLDETLRGDYELSLRELHGIHESERELFRSLESAQECFSDRISNDYLIIGSDWGGNQFLMTVTHPNAIFWWDHEDEELVCIAQGFTDLLRRIIPRKKSSLEILGESGSTEKELDAFLEEHNESEKVFYEAAKHGNLGLLQILIRRGIPVGDAFRYAAMNGQIDAVDFFISSGIEINTLMSDGRTALDWAAWDEDSASELRKRGARLSSEL